MSNSARDPLSLLKSLETRVKPASEHFADQIRAKPKRIGGGLMDLVPHAEPIGRGDARCHRISSRANLAGERSAAGYVCPAAEFHLTDPGPAYALLARDPAFEGVDPEAIAYIDTETTGLSGASGTYVFLVGIGWLRGAEFVVHQYFMEDYDGEEALLGAVAEELSRAEAVVTYNGKAFDMPLIATRFRMHRRELELPRLHLDLLHPARRLWKMKYPDCRLETVEREVLGVMRVSDIESALIPGIYFDYVRGRRRENMLPVIDHHAQDIFSLLALGRAMGMAVTEPEDPRFAHAGEQWGLAGIYQSARMEAESVAALERAILAARDEEFGFRLSMHLARKFKRARRDGEAVAIWEARAAQANADRLEPLIELAKHAEHRVKDFALARQWTERALVLARGDEELKSLIGTGERPRTRQGGDELLKRLDRVRRREAKVANSRLL